MISVFMTWKGQTEEARKRQMANLMDNAAGKIGYLTEQYSGAPYPTTMLCKEAFRTEDPNGTEIPAEAMRARLNDVTFLAKQKAAKFQGDPRNNSKELEISAAAKEVMPDDSTPSVRAFVDFVELAEKMEKETGSPVTIVARF